MASILKVDTLQDQAGNNIISESANVITIGASGDTITIPSGASMSGFNSTGIDDNATSTAITIDSSERVGIGTASPSTVLDVRDETNGANFIVGGSGTTNITKIGGGSGDNLQLFTNSTTPVMMLSTSGNVGIGTSSPSEVLHVVGDILATGGDFKSDANNYLGFSNDTFARFVINDSEKMRIDSSGNVGIGTTSPAGVLDIRNGTIQQVIIGNSGSYAGTEYGELLFKESSTELARVKWSPNGNTFQLINEIAAPMTFATSGSERMRIDSSGNVGIGTSSPICELHVVDTSGSSLIRASGDSGGTTVTAQLGGSFSGYGVIGTVTNHDLAFLTNDTERMRLSTSALFINTTSEPSQGDNGVQISATDSYHIFCRNSSASVFRTFGNSGEFRTIGNGNAQNTNNSYGAISDRELKENEVEANSQWNDIKALQIKNYNLKSQPNKTHLGVIAQDLEASGMNGVVEQNEDELYTEEDVLPEGKNIGDVKEKGYKTVKYSVLYMKSVKALQEAMTRIETLEAEVTALKNQP